MTFKDLLIEEASKRGYSCRKGHKANQFIWIGKSGTEPINDIHYELIFNTDGQDVGHDGNHCFAEIHFETNLCDILFQEFKKRLDNPQNFAFLKWNNRVNGGLRLKDAGIEISDEDDDLMPTQAQKALDSLDKLYDITSAVFVELKSNKEFYKQKYQMNNTIIDVLKQKKQIILQGAPGTGKTYTTAAIAVGICNGIDKIPSDRKELMEEYKKLVYANRVYFTTFHQSMDYEEFVEGIKPESENGIITYEVQDGIFKEICEAAKSPNESNFEDCYEQLLKALEERTEPQELETPNSTTFAVSKNNRDGLNLYTGPEKTKNGSLPKERIRNFVNGSQARAWKPYYNGVIQYLKDIYNLEISEGKPKNYVLIIDEINRANISKVLGELITLLEADKRLGEVNEVTVKLPYSKEEFGVPSNLYIIGTMNTADRSVGYIDYAIRRRFAFYTLKANKDILENSTLKTKDKAKDYYKKVETWMSKDNIVGDIEPDDLMVGHSYFLADDEITLNRKMKYEVIPLLYEYINDGILSTNVKAEIKNWDNELKC